MKTNKLTEICTGTIDNKVRVIFQRENSYHTYWISSVPTMLRLERLFNTYSHRVGVFGNYINIYIQFEG